MARPIEAPPPAASIAELAPALADPDARRVVRAVLAGDRDGFRVLVERESGAVFRVCYRVLGNLDEAHEAAQETFVSAYRSLPGWREDGPFAAWLARIALHVALRRSRHKRPVAWIDTLDPEAAVDEGAGQRRLVEQLRRAAVTAASLTDPASLALQAERAAGVRSAVLALDEPYREVVALRFFGELSVPEIARATGRPEGTVKTHLHRGLARLRRALGPMRGEP